jgi:2-amino-4-hydroxy-6-hydroxymethyldihydropteridine diphosphokinase
MSLIIATGANLGLPLVQLELAKTELQQHFELIAQSRIYKSSAVDYQNQPDFYNQVLEFKIPTISPEETIHLLMEIEKKLGRTREIFRGPRLIDIDIIFWGQKRLELEFLVIPHPRWDQRSFVVRPLQELPFFKTIEKCFTIPKSFEVEAFPV